MRLLNGPCGRFARVSSVDFLANLGLGLREGPLAEGPDIRGERRACGQRRIEQVQPMFFEGWIFYGQVRFPHTAGRTGQIGEESVETAGCSITSICPVVDPTFWKVCAVPRGAETLSAGR
jgi:hypothetical protein